MGSLQSPPAVRRPPLLNGSSPLSSQALGPSQLALQGPVVFPGYGRRQQCLPFQVRAEALESSSQDKVGRRQVFAIGAAATYNILSPTSSTIFAAEAKKGYQAVLDKKDGYTFLYPFGWQEVVIQGQDKVFKDVIEPLESVSVNLVVTSKEDVRELGSPQEVAEALVRKVLAPSTQKTKIIEASELLVREGKWRDGVDGEEAYLADLWKGYDDTDSYQEERAGVDLDMIPPNFLGHPESWCLESSPTHLPFMMMLKKSIPRSPFGIA